jgi:glucose-6-phosphate 1-dehydrogenase
MASSLILFGATGDLAQRMLLPSLFGLDAEGLLADDLRIIATARGDVDEQGFRDLVVAALERAIEPGRLQCLVVARFLSRLVFVPVDATDPSQFHALAEAVGPSGPNPAIFLSTAPSLFAPTIQGLAAAGLAGGMARIGVEKPLGRDLASSRAINDALAASFPEDHIFRIDHYLGKETVQNLLALRFANSLFEPIWHSQGIAHVQITVAETVGIEGRFDFYDHSGALRDMVQNHMLQLLALVAMEPPGMFDATAIRDEKAKALRSLRRITRETVATNTVTGQYQAGAIDGLPVPGYTDELGRSSTAETFVALKAHVDNWRWKGVPFYLRTGKRLPRRRSEILVQFNPVPHSIFETGGAAIQPNKLIIRLQPDENIRLTVMAKQPGLDRQGIRLREVPLDVGIDEAFVDTRRRIAYERLLLDLIGGDPRLFVGRDEVEAQWSWIDAIREGWAGAGMQPRSYPAGTWGPSAAIALTERDGVSWHD